MDPLRDRVAVITGGAGGIGTAIARAFAARGARLVLADLDEAALARTQADLERAGATVHTVRTDVGERAQVEALAESAVRRFGAVHVVCNNAGIATFGEIATSTHNDWVYTMRVNFWGVVHGIEAFVPRLIHQDQGGHVVNTASMAGLVGMQWLGIYTASVLFIAYFMRWLGEYGWTRTVIVSVAVVVAFYFMFEKWFLVPLPKGPIEAALGIG